MQPYKIWKSIGPGQIDTAKMYRAISREHLFVSSLELTLKGVQLNPVAGRADLVKLRYEDLGLPKFCSHETVRKAAKKHGLGLCTVEDAINLRYQYRDQPEGEVLMIPVMEFGECSAHFFELLCHEEQLFILDEDGRECTDCPDHENLVLRLP